MTASFLRGYGRNHGGLNHGAVRTHSKEIIE